VVLIDLSVPIEPSPDGLPDLLRTEIEFSEARHRPDPHGPRRVPRRARLHDPRTGGQIERLANLDKLPATGFTVACFPLRLVGASAAPARVVAILGNG
jgi:hypothetical protein